MTRGGEEVPDVELVALLASGDVQAAEQLYDRYASTLLALSIRIVRDRSEAEDVVHDAFVTMANRAAQYARERGTVIAWLVTLVRNLSIDRTRRRERRGSILRNVVAEEPRVAAVDPEELLSDARARGAIREALAAIPAVQRTTLELAFFDGLTYPEIAERENVPLGTIKSRAARALASLREALHEDGALGVPPRGPAKQN